MKKRILVTGSHGFVGNHLVRYILDNTDWDVVGIDSFRHAGDPLRNHDDPRYVVFCHDLNAPIGDRLSDKIGSVNYIINLASISDVDLSIRDPLWVWENNTRLIGNILAFAHLRKRQGLEKFIHCSTDEVFGPAPAGYFHREWDTICPSNPYSASKAAQEALCITYWRTYGLPVIITNCMNMVGETQEPTKFIPKIIGAMTNGGFGTSSDVVIHGSPENVGSRMYLDAERPGVEDILDQVVAGVQSSCTYAGAATIPEFHERAIVGIHSVDLVWGLGTLHCLTQQQPAAEGASAPSA